MSLTYKYTKNSTHTGYDSHPSWSFDGTSPFKNGSNYKATLTITLSLGDHKEEDFSGGTSDLVVFVGTEVADKWKIGTIAYKETERSYKFTATITGDKLTQFVTTKHICFDQANGDARHMQGVKGAKGLVLSMQYWQQNITPTLSTVKSVVGSNSYTMSGDYLLHGATYNISWKTDADGSYAVESGDKPTVTFMYKYGSVGWKSVNISDVTVSKTSYSYSFDTGNVSNTSDSFTYKVSIKGRGAAVESAEKTFRLKNTVLDSLSSVPYGTNVGVSWSLDTTDVDPAKAWGGSPTIELQAYNGGWQTVTSWAFATSGTPHCSAASRKGNIPFESIILGRSAVSWRVKIGKYYTPESIFSLTTPAPSSPVSSKTLVHGATYRLQWAYPAGYQAKDTLQVNISENGDEYYHVNVPANQSYVEFKVKKTLTRAKWFLSFEGNSNVKSSEIEYANVVDPTAGTHVAIPVTAAYPNDIDVYQGLNIKYGGWGNLSYGGTNNTDAVKTQMPDSAVKFEQSVSKLELVRYVNGGSPAVVASSNAFSASFVTTGITSVGGYKWYLRFSLSNSNTVYTTEIKSHDVEKISGLSLNSPKRGYFISFPVPAFSANQSAQKATIKKRTVNVYNATNEANPVLLSQISKTNVGTGATVEKWNSVTGGLKYGITKICYEVVYETDIGTTTSQRSSNYSVSTPQVSFKNVQPGSSSKTYVGISRKYGLDISVNEPTDSLISIAQGVAVKIYTKKETDDSWNQAANISGNGLSFATDIAISADGKHSWKAEITLNTGDVVTAGSYDFTVTLIDVGITNLKPAGGTIAPRANAINFSWEFAPILPEGDEDIGDVDIKQTNASVYWRANAADNWHLLKSISGTTTSVSAAAGYFAAYENIDWKVIVSTNIGTGKESSAQSVRVKDAVSVPVCKNPSGEFIRDLTNGITFEWNHIIETGTASKGFTVEYRVLNTSVWSSVEDQNTSKTACTVAGDNFSSETYEWRVKTQNSDGEYGSYSTAAVFAISVRPDAPVIRSVDPKPLAKIEWNSSAQVSCEIELDGVNQGTIYGYEKSWQSNQILEDGKHSISVKITDIFGNESDWTTANFTVINRPEGEVKLSGLEQVGQVNLTWSYEGIDFKTVYLLRDDEVIAISHPGEEMAFVDKCSVGDHPYKIRAFNEEGYYTDSEAIHARPKIDVACIAALDGDKWFDLKWRTSNYQKSVGANAKLVQFYGFDRPVYKQTEAQTVVHKITGAKIGYDNIRDVEHLQGQTVVYKDDQGHIAVGVIESVTITAVGLGLHKMAFDITETYQEELTYEVI